MKKMRTRLFSLLTILVLLMLLPASVWAQEGVVSGVVKDEAGQPIPYATVWARPADKGTSADARGRYRLTLPTGNCSLTASAVGYQSETRSLSLTSRTTCHFQLREEVVRLDDVQVTAKSQSRQLSEGAFSVNALQIHSSANKLVTLKDIVDRSAGVKVRRQGGVGSDYDLSINGLSGNSIRYFIDGMPLDSKGNDVGLDNIPLNLVERVELYKGVVPAHLSADALGGAVNIVTKRQRTNYLDASYGVGSFQTHSGDLSGQLLIPHTAWVVRPTVSLNSSKNNYLMKNVEVWDEEADRYILTDKRRFHDRYLSLFTQLEVGVNQTSWADQFFLSASYSHIDKELQTGAMQNKVYGQAERLSRSWGVSLRYLKGWGRLHTRFQASHTWDRSETVDSVYRKYSWDGTWMPSTGNEINNKARSVRLYRRPLTVVSAGLDYDLAAGHNLAFHYMLNRRGNKRSDRIDTEFVPTNDVVSKHILSLTYAQHLLQERLQNSLFVKQYINATSIRQQDNYTITGADQIEPHHTQCYWGAGWGSRYTFGTALAVKGSYEHSVRLPLSRELLGNGTTVYPNLTLKPESSNNYNLGLYGTWQAAPRHELTYEVGGFIRHVQNYIRARVSEREGMMQYANEPAIHIKGLDFEVGYTWADALQLKLNGTWSEARDLKKYKTDGNPSATYKNRVPNRPWLFGNAEASYTFRHLAQPSDRLRLGLAYQWIHWYYLNWEAYGAASSKARIPTQRIVDADLSYSWQGGRYHLTLSCTNLFDRLAFDNYMLQKPGRALYAKFRIFIH